MSEQYDLIPSDALTSQFEQMPEEVQQKWLEIQQQKMVQRQLAQLKQENESMRRDVEKMRAEDDYRHQQLSDGLREVADASARRMKHKDKYYVRTVLGKVFVPEISGKRMTSLLRVVGIIGFHDDPFSQYRQGKEPLAVLKPYSDWPTWLFHAEKTTAKIDSWLEENEWYKDFHNTTTKDERDKFIDFLFGEYVE